MLVDLPSHMHAVGDRLCCCKPQLPHLECRDAAKGCFKAPPRRYRPTMLSWAWWADTCPKDERCDIKSKTSKKKKGGSCWMFLSAAIKKEHASWTESRCIHAIIRYFLFINSSSHLIFHVRDSILITGAVQATCSYRLPICKLLCRIVILNVQSQT